MGFAERLLAAVITFIFFGLLILGIMLVPESVNQLVAAWFNNHPIFSVVVLLALFSLGTACTMED